MDKGLEKKSKEEEGRKEGRVLEKFRGEGKGRIKGKWRK